MRADLQRPSRRVESYGLAGVLAGAVAIHLFLWGAGLLAWFATDIVVGRGAMALCIVLGVLGLASPLRAASSRASLAHGIGCGAGWWCVVFATCGADLYSRNDRLFLAWLVCGVAVVASKAVCGPALVYVAARLSLAREPRGEGPLGCVREMLRDSGGEQGAAGRGSGSLWKRYGRWVRNAHRCLGLGTWRSYAIERAIQDAVDSASAGLRRSCEGKADRSGAAHRLAQVGAAELDLNSLLNDLADRAPGDDDRWIPRAAATWDLLQHANRLAADDLRPSEAVFLAALEQCGRSAPALAEAARSCRRSEVSTRLADHFAAVDGPALGGLECFAGILAGDVLVDVDLAGWAGGVVDALERRGVPEWAGPSLNRVRLSAESRVLRHDRWIEPAGVAARRVRRGLAAIAADAPELAHTTDGGLLPASLGRIRVPALRRGTGRFPGPHRPGTDIGPGRALAIVALSLVAACAAWIGTGQHPLGGATKGLSDIYRSPGYTAWPISGVDQDPTGKTLVLGSMGGGIHLIDTTSFRVRTEASETGGPSSNWISAVAVDSSGSIAARTHSSEPLAGGEPIGSGVDVRLASGSWTTVIAANGARGLDARELSTIVSLGTDKVLVLGSRLVLYQTGTRRLVELVPAAPEVALDVGEVFFTASEAQDGPGTRRFWLASRHAAADGQIGGLWEVQVLDGTKYSASRETHPPVAAEGIAQIVCRGETLLVRTGADRLYERTSEGWRLRVDGDTGLDLARIRHVAAIAGDRPAIWLTEEDEAGALRGVRLRVLQAGSPVPIGPWYRADLTVGVQGKAGELVRAADLDGGSDGPPPVAWWDGSKGEHVLVTAGARTGLLCFRAATSAPASTTDATVLAEAVPTPGERVVWLDSADGRLVLVLESMEGDRRRIAWLPCEALGTQTIAGSRTVQQSWLPDASLTEGVRIMACRPANEGRRIDVLTERGRIMSYDRVLNGWSSAQGTELLDPDGKAVGQISSADVLGEKLVVVASDGRVLWVALHNEAASARSLQMQLVHRPSPRRPSSLEVPVRVATEPDGVLLFMGQATAGEAVQPWTLRLDSPSSAALVAWGQDQVDTGKVLRASTLTRLQLGKHIGPLLAIDEAGTLLFRSRGVWRTVEGVNRGWTRILPAVGGTFVQGEAGIALVEGSPEKPTISAPLWPSQRKILQLPVSAMAALRTSGNGPLLVVAHEGGLAGYDPGTRVWTSVIEGLPAQEQESPGRWELCGTEDADGTSTHLWAVRRKGTNVSDVVLVRPESATRPLDGPWSSVVAASGGLAAARPDGTLWYVDPAGKVRPLTPAPSSEVGNVELMRACRGTGDVVWALDDRHRLLKLSGVQLAAEVVSVPGVSSIHDVACDGEGTTLVLSGQKTVHRWIPGSPAAPPVAVGGPAESLASVAGDVLAASPSTGRLSVVDGASAWTVAGGVSGGAQLGQVSAVLADGDWLWVAGVEGMVGRDPIRRQCIAVGSAVGVYRIERVGDAVIAWDSTGPRVVYSARDGLAARAPSFQTLSVLTSPSGKLLGLTAEPNGPMLRGLMAADPKAEGLFRAEAKLPDTLEAAAAFGGDSVILKGAGGELLSYTPRTRCVSLLAKASELPPSWDLMLAGNRVCVVPTGAQGQRNLLVVEDHATVRVVGEGVRSVLQVPDRVWWIQADGSVMSLGQDGRESVLSRVASAGLTASPPVAEIVCDSKGVVWWLAEGEATGYDLGSGPTPAEVRSVERLGNVQGRAVGVISAGSGLLDVAALDNGVKLNSEPMGHVGLGVSNVLGWSMKGDTLVAERLGDTPFHVSRRVVPRSGPGSPVTAERWAALDGRFIYLGGLAGVEVYDAEAGEWRSTQSGPSTKLGRVGTNIVVVRDTKAGTALDFFVPGEVAPRQTVEARGEALFTGERYVELRAAEEDAVQLGLASPSGEFDSVCSFPKALDPFAAESSVAVDVTDGSLALAGLAPERNEFPSRWVLFHGSGERVVPISGMPEEVMRHAAGTARFGDSVVIWGGSGGAAVVRAETGEVVHTVMDCGTIGTEAWTVTREQDGTLVVTRLRDQVPLGSLLGASEADRLRSATAAAFRTVDGSNVLLLKLTPRGKKGSTEYVSVALQQGGLGLTPTSSLVVGDAQASKRFSQGKEGSLQVLGRRLAADGWFDAGFPTKFERSARSDEVEVTMRDGSRRIVQVKQELSTVPVASTGEFELRDGQFQWRTRGVVLGAPSAGTALPADQWKCVMPVGRGAFYSVDAIGQLWWWGEPGAARRTPVVLPKPGGVESLELRRDGNESEVVALGLGGSVLCAVVDGRVVAERPPHEHCEGPGTRSGALGGLRWARTKTGMEMFQRVASDDGTSEEVALQPGPGGLDTDRPRALCRIPAAPGVWFDLGRTASGRTLVCPANQTPRDRLKNARLVARLESQVARSPFTIGTLHFSPAGSVWHVDIGGVAVPVRQGRLAIDQARHGVTVKEPEGLALWLSTDMAGVLVRQLWGDQLASPELMPTPVGVEVVDLRVRAGVLFVQDKASGWFQRVNGKWEPVSPDWTFSEGTPSQWRYSAESRELSYAGELTEWLDGKTAALAADVLTRDLESDGSSRVRAGAGGIAFQSAGGGWYLGRRDRTVAQALQEPPGETENTVPVSAANAAVPGRSAPGATFTLTDDRGASVPLPWRLREGRLPHNTIESVQRWTNSGIQVRLTDGMGYRVFKTLDSPAAAPVVSRSLIAESSPSVDLSVHSGVMLDGGTRLAWRREDQSYSLSLDPKSPGLAPGVIGPLGVLGNPIDDPEQVRPLYLREGRIEFVFGGRAWSTPPMGGTSSNVPTSAPFPGAHARLDVEPSSGRLVLSDTLGTGDGLAPSVLGLFVDDGRWNQASSVQATAESGTVQRTRLRRLGSAGFDVPIERDSNGWRCPLELPRGAVFDNTGALVVLGSDGQTLARWLPKQSDVWAWGGAFPVAGDPASAVWRDGDALFLSTGLDTPPKALEVRDGHSATRSASADGPQKIVDVMRGAFALGRLTGDGSISAFQLGSGGDRRILDPWRGLPGSKVERAFLCGPDDLIWQDRYGVQRVSLEKPHAWAFAGTGPAGTRTAVIERFLGAIFAGLDTSNFTTVSLDPSDTGIRFEPPGDHTGHQQVGQWEVRQPRPKGPVTISTLTGHLGPAVVIGNAAKESYCVGSLAIDRSTCMVEYPGGKVSIITPAGALSAEESGPLVPFAAEARSLASQTGLGVLRSEDGGTFVGTASAAKAMDPATGRIVEAQNLKKFMYFGHAGDWRVRQDAEELVFERFVRDGTGVQVDVLRGSELFTHGHFAFDHVEDVWLDPTDVGTVRVLTARACESLRAGPGHPVMEAVALRRPGAVLSVPSPSIQGLSPRAAGVATRTSRDGLDEWVCTAGDSSFRLRLVTQVSRSHDDGVDHVTQTFVAGNRMWVVLNDGVYWIEMADRWKAKRVSEGVQEAGEVRSAAASSPSD